MQLSKLRATRAKAQRVTLGSCARGRRAARAGGARGRHLQAERLILCEQLRYAGAQC